MNKYRDFDNYLKEYPSEDGWFGKYGGNFLKDPELIKAFNEYAEGYNTSPPSLFRSFAASAGTFRAVPPRCITARLCRMSSEGPRSI